MAFRKCSVVLMCWLAFIGTILAQDITLELQMPGSMFGPGSPFSLDLSVTNAGPELNDTQMFVALSIGTGDFWFYPGWKHYPPDIDWGTVDVPAGMADTWEILPEFPWPSGAGEFEGAMFYAAIVHNGELMSNLADFTFRWTEEPVPTCTPTQLALTATPTSTPPPNPTSTPTAGPGTPTSTPSAPTPTPPTPTGFVYIAPGGFTMGSPSTEACRISEETQHEVTLTRGFYMMVTEVTRQMWADLKAVQPTLPIDPSEIYFSPTMNHPVQMNTWYESVLFANLMSVQYGFTRCYYKDEAFTTPVDATNYTSGTFYCNFTANGYRLPTESEWEYACRAGSTGPFSCSETNYNSDNCTSCTEGTHPALEQYCVCCANDPGLTAVVGSKLPNPAGFHDIHGNVWEWCWDWYGLYPDGSVTDPTGPESGSYRELRGGSWDDSPKWCRSASRYQYPPSDRDYRLGFRLLRTTL